MSFFHGKSTRVYVNGHPASSFLDAINTNASADTVETTVFTDTSKTYVMGTKTATLNAEGLAGGTTDTIEQFFQDALAAENIWVWYPATESSGSNGYGMKGFDTQLDIKGSISGAVRVAAACQSNIGRESVTCIRPLAVATASSSGGAVNNDNKTTGGGAAYLYVAATNTSDAAIVIDHSSDGSSWETVATFDTAPLGASAQRVAISGTIRQYVKASCTVTTNCNFGAAINRSSQT